MPIISGGTVAPDLGEFMSSTAPVAGTTEVQTLTIATGTNGGTFKIKFDGHTTNSISWNATAGTFVNAIDAALEALPNIGSGRITAANSNLNNGIGDVTLTFATTLSLRAQNLMTVTGSALTGTNALASIAETTAGVDATFKDAPKGARLIDLGNGVVYVNTGSDGVPTWTKVGSQS
jgi:hypothetical protein